MIERVALPRLTVNLGRLGENDHVRVRVPISEYTEMYPDAHFTLLNRLPGADSSYPVPTTETDENYLYWTVTNTDLVQPGYGKCQLIVLQGATIAKSVDYDTFVGDALDNTGEIPNPWDGWQVRFARLVADAETSAEGASGSATAAETAQNAAERAQAASEAARSAADRAQSASQAAQEKAESAENKAEDAQGKAERAQEFSESARDAAASSADKALKSQRSAASSESGASASALISEGFATGEQGGDPVASGKYYRNNAKHYAEQASQSAEQADNASQAIQDMGVAAITVKPGEAATVTKHIDPDTGAVTLTFGLPTGLTPDFSIGTVATGEPGSDASVTITGTDEKPILNLTIPRGDTGLPGIDASVSDHTLIITKNAR